MGPVSLDQLAGKGQDTMLAGKGQDIIVYEILHRCFEAGLELCT